MLSLHLSHGHLWQRGAGQGKQGGALVTCAFAVTDMPDHSPSWRTDMIQECEATSHGIHSQPAEVRLTSSLSCLGPQPVKWCCPNALPTSVKPA